MSSDTVPNGQLHPE
ncbi:hypothetical protein AVEN_23052-1, partial [Araneus ventricosus]